MHTAPRHRPRYVALVSVAAVLTLPACGGTPSLPGAASPTGSSPYAQSQSRAATGVRFVFTADFGGDGVSAFIINGKGQLKPVAHSPFVAGTEPDGVAIDPTAPFVYVTNYSSAISGSVSAYSINAKSGALTQVSGSPFASGNGPQDIAIDPTGSFAYVADTQSSNVSAYTISESGALTPIKGSPFSSGGAPVGIAVDPTGSFVFTANSGSNNVSAFKIDAKTGALTQVSGSPFPAGTGPFAVAVDPSGAHAYVANQYSNNVYAYSIGTAGALTQISGSPFAGGTNPIGVAIAPSGAFAYVSNYGSMQDVSGYSIDASTGALTPVKGSPFEGGNGSQGVATDATGKFLYVANEGSGSISAYAINAKGGALKKVPGSPFTGINGPFGIATCQMSGAVCKPAVL
jgi:6-phosphogluconolactonase